MDRKTKWWTSMISKYGSEEAVREYMANNGMKAEKTGTGGFAYMKKHDPERLSSISSVAGKKSKRTK